MSDKPLSDEDLTELERKYREATAGPWAWDYTGDKDNDWSLGVTDPPVAGHVDLDANPETVVVAHVVESGTNATVADAVCIAALHNAWPGLRDTIASLRSQLSTALRERDEERAHAEKAEAQTWETIRTWLDTHKEEAVKLLSDETGRLEKERDAALRERDEAKAAVERLRGYADDLEQQSVEAALEVDEAKEKRDAYRAALENVDAFVRSVAKEAEQAWADTQDLSYTAEESDAREVARGAVRVAQRIALHVGSLARAALSAEVK